MGGLQTSNEQRNSGQPGREARLHAIFVTAPDGIVTFDDVGAIESLNPAAERLFLVSAEVICGQPVSTLLSLPSRQEPRPSVRELFPGLTPQTSTSCELESVRSDGSHFPAHWTVGSFCSGDQQFHTAIVRDQSEHRQLQCELAQAQKLESVGQLAAGIAHEINTPTQYVADNTRFILNAFQELGELIRSLQKLTAQGEDESAHDEIKLRVRLRELLAKADVDYFLEEVPTTIEQTLGGIERIGSIVRAMKEFSHPGTGEKLLANVHEMLETTLTVSRNEWKYCAEVALDFGTDLPPVPCFPSELNQAFLNIIVNAAQAISESRGQNPLAKGRIAIRTRRAGDWAEIEIEDDGAGIPLEIVGRIFDPFFTTKPLGKGTGQGLAIARSVVVDKHGGTIEVRSKLGIGTLFRIRLPISISLPAEPGNQARRDALTLTSSLSTLNNTLVPR
jgi:PAS domain S-box-containing protein